MKRFLLLTTIFSGILFFSACTSVKTVVLNVQRPAEITLPKTIQSIGIVNNAIPQPSTFGHQRLKYSEKGERELDEVTVESDSSCIWLTEALFEELSQMNYLKNISFYEFPLREDLAFQDIRPVDSLDVKDLAQIMNVDAILSLDRFIIGSVVHSQLMSFEAEGRFLDMKVNAVFHLYSKDGRVISPPLSFQDSIYWEGLYSGGHQISYEGIPDMKDAVRDAIDYTAETVAQALTPQWFGEYRTYYGDVKDANKKVESDNWKEALEIWKSAYETEQKNTKKKARLAYNIALANEVSDDIREALSWAEKSVKLFNESTETSIDIKNKEDAESYYNHLMDRFREFKVLDLQERTTDPE